jgi:hypothetical protein
MRCALLPPPLTPSHKGEGNLWSTAPFTGSRNGSAASMLPSPLWGRVRGGGVEAHDVAVAELFP